MGLLSDLTAIVSTTEYDLSDGSICWVERVDGVGQPALHRLRERGPQQHGETDVGFRLDPRTVRLILSVEAETEAGLESKLANLTQIFGPRVDAISLEWQLAGGETRRLDCFYRDDMSLASQDRTAKQLQRVAVVVEAPDPAFYDPVSVSVQFSLAGGSSAFDVPMSVPTGVGTSTLDQTVTVTYAGSFRTFPTVTIYGPITDPVVENLSTGETLDFTGITIASGDHYVIDTAYGVKTVEDSSGTNKIADLTEDSDLATFHLAPDPVVVNGDNDIQVTGTAVDAETEVYLSYFDRYLGLYG